MQDLKVNIAAIICAAGSSSRMGGKKKEYQYLDSPAGFTVLGAAVTAFASCPQIDPIVITVPSEEKSEQSSIELCSASLPPELLAEVGRDRVLFVSGGPTRRASVHNALLRLESYKLSHVLIHDGARPWIKRDLIERIIEAAIRYDAVIPALPLIETPKELAGLGFSSQEDGALPGELRFIKRHLRREELCSAQTPQGFSFPEILRAHEKAKAKEERENFEYTDDVEVWGEFIGQAAVIPGDPENRKITFPKDLDPKDSYGRKYMQRIGMGRDMHRLIPGRKFLLGGVEMPFEKGEQGHSDGDVLAHAICDALLGAVGMGDIGELYPPGDPSWKDADSLALLRNAWERVRSQGWRLVNLDCTVTCEMPKILPHRDSICRSLSQTLEVEPGLIFVKGKTYEGLGSLGNGEAVEALAVCLIEKS
jgi:2-C-methyl-D-erythritol 4-phosphate cytidylyltransferase/2-C-methyl-D-erythritol 2,4-cyclodiphosphate synthase